MSYTGDLYTGIHASIGDPAFLGTDLPRVVYFPTDRRLEIPDESFKAAGNIEDSEGFYYRFRAAEKWTDSLGALLYGARWADLNAKEEGHPEKATHFESYAQAFQAFFGESKNLVWEGGKLFGLAEPGTTILLGKGLARRVTSGSASPAAPRDRVLRGATGATVVGSPILDDGRSSRCERWLAW